LRSAAAPRAPAVTTSLRLPKPVEFSTPVRRNSKPAADLSKLPASIRESLAKLAGDPEDEKEKKPAAPAASDTTTGGDR
jgi:hypothetical protein